jgi:ferrous iron transport protein B
MKGSGEAILQDLPGIYSLSPYTLEEVVCAELSRFGKAGRNSQYCGRQQPGAKSLPDHAAARTWHSYGGCAQHDGRCAQKRGCVIDPGKLGEALGCGVVETSALKGLGC